jgi:hypothetical protein
MGKTNGNLLKLMDAMIERAQLEKSASNLDLASDGKSSHPSANVDDGTQPAKEGERSAENSADIAKDVPDNVEQAGSKNTPGDSKKPTDTMGTQSMSSDEARAGNVDTPKSTPSMASNPAVGPNPKTKYGSDQLIGEANSILGELAKVLNISTEKAASGDEAPAEEAPAEEAPASEEAPAEEAPAEEAPQSDPPQTQQGDKEAADAAELYKKAAGQYPEDEEAGYVAASMLINYLNGDGTEKQAADGDAYTSVVGEIVKNAEADADAYVSFMQGYQKAMHGQLKKEAGGDPAALMAAMGGGAGGPEGAMGEMGAMGGAEGGADPAALAALAGGGGPEEAMLGGEGGEMGGEELDDEAVIEALAEALDEAGITPEELAQVVAEAQGEIPAEMEGEAAAEEGAGEEELAAGEDEAAEGEALEEGLEAQAAAKSAPHVKKAAAASSTDALKAAVRKLVRG